MSIDSLPTSRHDIPQTTPEVETERVGLSSEAIDNLRRLIGEKQEGAGGGNPQSNLRAAELTVKLMKEALETKPSDEALAAVTKYNGPMDTMSHAARWMHVRQTGHPLHELPLVFNPSIDEVRGALDAVALKTTDGRWHSNPDASVDGGRGITAAALDALAILTGSGDVPVRTETAHEISAYLKGA